MADTLVTCAAAYRDIVSNLLGRTVVAETMKDAIAISRRYDHRYRIVTLDGQLVNAGGSLTGGSAAKGSGILSRANELKRLRAALDTLTLEKKQCEAELEDARVELQDKQSELETKQVALQQKVAEANALLAGLESDINAYKSVYDQYEQQQKNVQSQIDKQVEELRRQEEANKNNSPGYDPGKANGSTGTMMWPCPSCHYITSPFGWRYHPIYHTQKYHSGVDIGASYGATIVAADGGTIITAGSVSGYGNCVVINHGNGITTLYGHMSSIAVSVGQKVSKGQTIGYVGSTGNSTGPHLHWEVTVNGVRQNPLNYAS